MKNSVKNLISSAVFAFALLFLQFSFQFIYFDKIDSFILFSTGFTVGWTLMLAAVAYALPLIAKRIFIITIGVLYTAVSLAHGVLLNIFKHFLRIGDIVFTGDGIDFMSIDYIMLRKLAIAASLFFLALCIFAAFFAKKDKFRPVLPSVLFAVGLLTALGIRYIGIGSQASTVVWDSFSDPKAVYTDFSDTKASMKLCGLYQYTFRDISISTGIFEHSSKADIEAVDEYINSKDMHEDNAMTGIFKGKNLIMIQLEATDTWLINEKYMPNLYRFKSEGIAFEDHYTPAFITAGTFNTEFIVNTGLLPATEGVPTSVYVNNEYPYALSSLMKKAGYSANSFHGSEGSVYNRAAIHKNFGYEEYHGGTDMGMPDYTMDSNLICGYDKMVSGSPFFSFIITFSPHGPYNSTSSSYKANEAKAKEMAERSEENYVNAVASVMETDKFIGELADRLEKDGLLDDTVLVFYADHYDYYMLDDPFNMEIKGVDNYDMLQCTDFFIWANGLEATEITMPSSSLDVLPTLCNLFGLDTNYSVYFGKDLFSVTENTVVFQDLAWYDGNKLHPGTEAGEVADGIRKMLDISKKILKTDWFSK